MNIEPETIEALLKAWLDIHEIDMGDCVEIPLDEWKIFDEQMLRLREEYNGEESNYNWTFRLSR